MIEHDENRERELQELCRLVMEEDVEFDFSDYGPDAYYCPYCCTRTLVRDVPKRGITLADIKHYPNNCAYLIAKDLSAAVKEVTKERENG